MGFLSSFAVVVYVASIAAIITLIRLRLKKQSTTATSTAATASSQTSSATSTASNATQSTLNPVATSQTTASTTVTASPTVTAPVAGPDKDIIAQLTSQYGSEIANFGGIVASSVATQLVDHYIAKAFAKNIVSSALRSTAEALGETGGKIALKAMSKIGVTALRGAARFAEALDLGPAGVAMLGFDVLTLGLDIADPMGINQMLTLEAMYKTKAELYAAAASGFAKNNQPWPSMTGPLDTLQQDQLAWAQVQATNSIVGSQLIDYALTLPSSLTYDDLLAAISQKSDAIIAAIPQTQMMQTMCASANGVYDSGSGGCSWADERSCMAAFANGPFQTRWDPSGKKCYISAAATAKDTCDKQNLQWDFENEVCILQGDYCANRLGQAAKVNSAYPPSPGAVDCYTTTAESVASGVFGTTITGFFSSLVNTKSDANGVSLQPPAGTVAYTPTAAPAWLVQAPPALYYWQEALLGNKVPAWPTSPGTASTITAGNYGVIASRSGSSCNTRMGVANSGLNAPITLYATNTTIPSVWTIVSNPGGTNTYNIVMGSFNSYLGCSAMSSTTTTCTAVLSTADDPDGKTTWWCFFPVNGGYVIQNQQPGSGLFLTFGACGDDRVSMSSTPCVWTLLSSTAVVSQQATSISFSTGTKPVVIKAGQ